MYASVKVWERTVDIAIIKKQERHGEVVGIVSQRLIQSSRFEAAADFLSAIGDIEGAVK